MEIKLVKRSRKVQVDTIFAWEEKNFNIIPYFSKLAISLEIIQFQNSTASIRCHQNNYENEFQAYENPLRRLLESGNMTKKT